VPYPDLNLLSLDKVYGVSSTVFIPFYKRVLIISTINGADFSIRLSEACQAPDPISGIQFLLRGRLTDLNQARVLDRKPTRRMISQGGSGSHTPTVQ
jgi:hypothetical protein